MEEKKKFSFELHEEMMKAVAQEFAPEDISKKLAEAARGKSDEEIPGIGERIFTDFGVKWGTRTVALGETYMDRTYEIMRESIEQTGSPSFPLIPQRFIEIAYLSTQQISTLPVIENNYRRLIFRIEKCRTYQSISEGCGEEVAQALTCRHGCLGLCLSIMENLEIQDIKAEMSARTPDDGFCEFVLRRP